MSLSDALNDIQGDVLPITENIATEDVKIASVKQSNFKVCVECFDRKVIDKFNTLYNVLLLKKSVQNLNKVDRQIAQEVFTMIPDLNPVEKAKVTNYPSTLNKDVINNAVSDIKDIIPEESFRLLEDIHKQINVNIPHIKNVVESINANHGFLEDQHSRLTKTPPIVIKGQGESVNLYTSKIADVFTINDTELDYPKYANQLVSRFERLTNNKSLNALLHYLTASTTEEDTEERTVSDVNKVYGKTLEELVTLILNTQQLVASSSASLFEKNEAIDTFIHQETRVVNEVSSELINNVEELITTLKYFQMLYEAFVDEGSFIDELKELLAFID